MIYWTRHSILSFLLIFLTACSGVNFSQWHFPYMMQVDQGNYITNEQFRQLKIGMTKDQVTFVIGHPLTQYMFDLNRWDFIYQQHKNDKLTESYNVSVFFNTESKVINITESGNLFNTKS